MAEDDKKRGGFDSLKSLIISGATIGPAAIGLGLGIRGGMAQISSNRAIGNMLTGGRPNELEMIGRNAGQTNAGMIRDSLAAARASASRGDVTASMDLFAAAAKTSGPQRNALYQAFVSMLNSPYLNLDETQIAQESTDLLGKINDPDFEKSIMNQIDKRTLEVGTEKKSEFITQMNRLYQQSLKLEESLKSSTSNVQFFGGGSLTKISSNPTAMSVASGRLNGRYTGAAERFKELQDILSKANMGGSAAKYTIREVEAGGGKGLFASVSVKGTSFDVPLSLIRNKHMKKAHGGLMTLGSLAQVTVGGAFDADAGRFISGEQHILNQLRSTLEAAGGGAGKSRLQLEGIFKSFKERTYDTGQFINPYASEPELAEAYQRSYLHELISPNNPKMGGEDLVKRIMSNPAMRSQIEPYGVTPGNLAGDMGGPSRVYQSDVPAGGNAWAGYLGPGDLKMASRIQQADKKFTIIRSNKPLNFIPSLNWNSESGIGTRSKSISNTVDNDALNAFKVSRSSTKASYLTLYQFEEDFADELDAKGKIKTYGGTNYHYARKLNIYEGTSIAGSIHGTMSETKTLRAMGSSGPGGKQSAFIAELLTKWNSSKGKPFKLQGRNIQKLLKETGGIIGYDKAGRPVDMGFSSKAFRGLEIRGLEEVKKNGSLTGEYKIHYRLANKRGRAMKGHGTAAKGLYIGVRDKDVMTGEFEHSLGKDTSDTVFSHMRKVNPGRDINEGVSVTGAKQLLRSGMPINLQMMTGAAYMMESRGATKKDIVSFTNQMHGLKGTDLASTIVQKLGALGASHSDIAAVVASQYRSDKSSLGAISGGNAALEDVIKQQRGALGVETMSLASQGTGVGKPAKLERRSLHGIIRHMKTLGATTEQITSMIGDFASRSAGSKAWEEMLTNRSLLASARSMDGKDISPLSNFLSSNAIDGSIENKTLSEFGTKVKGNPILQSATGINLTFDNPNAATAAKDIFGKDQVFIPGNKGTPSLHSLALKRGGKKIDYMSEYQQGLSNMLRTAGNSGSSVEQIKEAMLAYKGQVAKGYETSVENMIIGKVAGSAQGTFHSLNKAEFSAERFKDLTSMARKDRMQSAFVSDTVFFKAIAGLRQRAAQDKAEIDSLIDKSKKFLFETKKENSSIYGLISRHPTLGEGHVRFQRIRRAGTSRDTGALLQTPGVARFLNKTLGVKANIKNLGSFLGGDIGKSHQRAFASMLVKQAHSFMGSDGAVYLPTMDGKVSINQGGSSVTVPHTFSGFNQLVGDTDGDQGNLVLAHGKENESFIRNVTSKNLDAGAFFKSEMEWKALQYEAKRRQELKEGLAGPISDDIRSSNEVLAEIRGKKIGPYSVAIDKLRTGVLAFGKDDNLSRQGILSLSLLEEILIKSSKKGSSVSSVAEEFSRAMNDTNPDYARARAILEEHSFGSDFKATVSMDIDLPEYMGTRTADIDTRQIFDHMFESLQELKTAGGMSHGNIKRMRNRLDRGVYDSISSRMLEELESGKHSLVAGYSDALSGNTVQAANASLIDLASSASNSVRSILTSRRMMVPAAIGAGAGLLALNMSAPGYSPKPLGPPDANVPTATREAIASGTILNGLTNAIDGSPLMPSQPNTFPSISSNNVIQNGTYVEGDGQNARSEFTIDGIQNVPQVGKLISAFGLTNNQMFIQDNRRPISKNFIDQLRED